MNQPAAQQQVEYVGFWARVLAAFIDSIAVGLLLAVVAYVLGLQDLITLEDGKPAYHPEAWGDTAIIRFLYAAVVIGFWSWKMATPGKMVVGAVIVDAATLGKPGFGQLIGRYLGYFVSTIPLGLGLLWVAFDRRKQGWHDKLAGTVVIKKQA